MGFNVGILASSCHCYAFLFSGLDTKKGTWFGNTRFACFVSCHLNVICVWNSQHAKSTISWGFVWTRAYVFLLAFSYRLQLSKSSRVYPKSRFQRLRPCRSAWISSHIMGSRWTRIPATLSPRHHIQISLWLPVSRFRTQDIYRPRNHLHFTPWNFSSPQHGSLHFPRGQNCFFLQQEESLASWTSASNLVYKWCTHHFRYSSWESRYAYLLGCRISGSISGACLSRRENHHHPNLLDSQRLYSCRVSTKLAFWRIVCSIYTSIQSVRKYVRNHILQRWSPCRKGQGRFSYVLL